MIRRFAAAVRRAVVGQPFALPAHVIARYPELRDATWRVGGLPPRVGGWCLGAPTVAGITLWRTVYLAPGVTPHVALLLHELGHVRQFAASRSFPLRYCWQSLRRGYVHNPFELEAEAFARRMLAEREVREAGGPSRRARSARPLWSDGDTLSDTPVEGS